MVGEIWKSLACPIHSTSAIVSYSPESPAWQELPTTSRRPYIAGQQTAQDRRRRSPAEMIEAGADPSAATRLLELISLKGTNQEILTAVRNLGTDDDALNAAVENLAELFKLLESLAPGKACFYPRSDPCTGSRLLHRHRLRSIS